MIVPRSTLAGAAILVLVFTVRATPVAASSPVPVAPIVGQIARITAAQLYLKTSFGLLTGKISTISEVVKTKPGSLKDIRRTAFVTLTLSANGKTVRAVAVGLNLVHRGFPRSKSGAAGHPKSKRSAGSIPIRVSGGAVLNVTSRQIRLRTLLGQTVSLSLSRSLKVTKAVRGSRRDLHAGENVRIMPLGRAKSSFILTILPAVHRGR